MFASNIIIDVSYNLSNYIQFEVFADCLKWVAYINTLFSPCYRLGWNGKLLKCLRILITTVYFKDWNWICITVYCISSFVVCIIAFCSEFPDIPDTSNCKALWVSRKRKKFVLMLEVGSFLARGYFFLLFRGKNIITQFFKLLNLCAGYR